jgi:ABC-2 type transport system permease protein
VIAYVQHAGICLRAALTYRLAALSGILTQLAFGLIRVEVLEACYRSGAQAAGMALAAAQDYIWLGQALLRVIPMRTDEDLVEAMRRGTIANDLIRPLDAYLWWWSRSVGRCAAQTALRSLPLIVLTMALGALHPPASVLAGLAFVLLSGVAILLSCALRILLTLLGDWSTGANAIAPLMLPVIWMLCGITVPLPLMPPELQGVIAILPFRALLDTPLRAWSGDCAGAGLGWAVLHQLAWLAALVAVGQALARRGLRRLSLQGG